MTAHPMLFVTGKGGTGKTTVALALGLASARRGRRTIVCELDGQQRAPRAFGVESPGTNVEVELDRGLWSVSIDFDTALAEWLGGAAGRAAAAVLTRADLFAYLVAAAPGAAELVAIGKAWDLTRPRRHRGRSGYDCVVVDGPATGHALALLQAPREYAELVRAGPVGGEARAVADFLADQDATAVVLVTLATELAVNETLDLAAAIERELGHGCEAVVVNQLLRHHFDSAELEQLDRVAAGAGNPALAGAARVAHLWSDRAERQAVELARVRARIDAPVLELPFIAATLDRHRLGELARDLAELQ